MPRLDCTDVHTDLDLHCLKIALGPFSCIMHHLLCYIFCILNISDWHPKIPENRIWHFIHFILYETNITVLLTSFGKTFFAWCFILNENDHILSGSIFLLCFCTLFSNIYCKINFTAENESDLFNSKLDFWTTFIRKHLLLFFTGFELLMFHNNTVKVSKLLNKQNLLKNCNQTTYPTDFALFAAIFSMGKKMKNIWTND